MICECVSVGGEGGEGGRGGREGGTGQIRNKRTFHRWETCGRILPVMVRVNKKKSEGCS